MVNLPKSHTVLFVLTLTYIGGIDTSIAIVSVGLFIINSQVSSLVSRYKSDIFFQNAGEI